MRKFFVILLCTFSLSILAENLSCDGYELQSDEFYFRGSGSGIDTDSLTAKRKATLLARQRVATQVAVRINAVTDAYLHTIVSGDVEEIKFLISTRTSTIANQLLIGCSTICYQMTRSSNGEYLCSLAIEVPVRNLKDFVDYQQDATDEQSEWRKYREYLFNQLDSIK